MWNRAEGTLNRSGQFPMQGSSPNVLDRKVRNAAVIHLTGPLVGELPVHVLRDQIGKRLYQGTKNFAVNLAEVPYVDSYGLNALAGAYNLVRDAGGRIKFFATSEQVLHTLESLHLDRVFELFEDEASALSSFY